MTEITVQQRVKAPRSTVYRYLTESEKWVLWQGVSATLDPSVGGIFTMSMENGMTARGQFVELVKDEKVVFTWGWVDRPGIPPGSTTVTIDLVEDADATLVVLTHTGLAPEEVTPHRAGWETHLLQLSKTATETTLL